MQDARMLLPEELGGGCYFEPVAMKSDWIPTHGHFPLSKKDGGRRALDNAILAHRLCNRLDYSHTRWPFVRARSQED